MGEGAPWFHYHLEDASRALSAALDAPCDEVRDAFGMELLRALNQHDPARQTQDDIDLVAIERAVRSAERLVRDFNAVGNVRRSYVERGELDVSGTLQTVAERLKAQVRDLKRRPGRQGGRNIRAYAVAEAVGRVFRRKGRRLTFGNLDGAPSTPFCRAVQDALAVFGIAADWRGPARAAIDRYKGAEQGKLTRA